MRLPRLAKKRIKSEKTPPGFVCPQLWVITEAVLQPRLMSVGDRHSFSNVSQSLFSLVDREAVFVKSFKQMIMFKRAALNLRVEEAFDAIPNTGESSSLLMHPIRL